MYGEGHVFIELHPVTEAQRLETSTRAQEESLALSYEIDKKQKLLGGGVWSPLACWAPCVGRSRSETHPGVIRVTQDVLVEMVLCS